MSTILILNNYDIRSFVEDCPKFPDHFFYGINYLYRRGDKIVALGDKRNRFLSMIETINTGVRLHIPLGDLSQQWNVLPEVRSADLIYSPCDSVAQFLCYLRAVGLIKISHCLSCPPSATTRPRELYSPAMGKACSPGYLGVPKPQPDCGQPDKRSRCESST